MERLKLQICYHCLVYHNYYMSIPQLYSYWPIISRTVSGLNGAQVPFDRAVWSSSADINPLRSLSTLKKCNRLHNGDNLLFCVYQHAHIIMPYLQIKLARLIQNILSLRSYIRLEQQKTHFGNESDKCLHISKHSTTNYKNNK